VQYKIVTTNIFIPSQGDKGLTKKEKLQLVSSFAEITQPAVHSSIDFWLYFSDIQIYFPADKNLMANLAPGAGLGSVL